MLLAYDHDQARERLDEAGFASRTYDQIPQPELQTVDGADGVAIPHLVYGDLDAPYKLLETASYSTELDRPHFRLRLAGHQAVLGAEYCVIGVQAFDPKTESLNREQRKAVKHSDFTPLSDRVLRVASALDIESAFAYGQSMGGDVSMQLAHNTQFDENRGQIEIKAVGALDAARSTRRHRIQAVGAGLMMKAFGDSGKEFYDNIWEAGYPALLEAWELEDGEGAQEAQRKAFEKQSVSGVVKYWLSDIPANWAVTKGFATGATVDQAIELAEETDSFVMVGKQRTGTIMDSAGFRKLIMASIPRKRGNLALYVDDGDHSDDDNIERSAGRVLHFADNAQHYLERTN